MQTEGEERCPGQGKKQRHGVGEASNGPDAVPAFAQQESEHKRRQRSRQVMSEDHADLEIGGSGHRATPARSSRRLASSASNGDVVVRAITHSVNKIAEEPLACIDA